MKRPILITGMLIVMGGAAVAGFYYQRHQSETRDGAYQAASQSVIVNEQKQQMKGRYRPDFSLADVNGRMHHISEWDGRVVALNFWATWCPPCLKEIPEFIKLQAQYRDRGLQFIGIALQRPEDVTEFMQTQGMNYPVLAGERAVIKITKSYGNDIGALPYTVIVDRNGRIAFTKFGQLTGETAERVIAALL
ncbi:MAG: peroxiredoxin family protein [Gammaproteobacteria bacterium]